MKRNLLISLVLGLTTTATLGDYADSVWLDYQEGLASSGDVILTDIQVEETTPYTFYAGLVWDTGYMGLQQGGSGNFKHVHFSVWDPPSGGFADLVWAADDVVTERFGGEGTGWKAMWPFDWDEDITYRLCVALVHRNSATHYMSFFFDPAAGEWKHLATFRRGDALLSFSYVASFVEDFGGTLSYRRSCLLGNAWLRTLSTWIDLRTARYASGGSQTNKDADLVGDTFRLETGGNTSNDTPVGTMLMRAPGSTVPVVTVLDPPLITSEPTDATIATSDNAVIAVLATGAEPLTYQWFLGPAGDVSQPVADATEPAFTTATLDVDATFWVLVANPMGSTRSRTATITVLDPPMILLGPPSEVIEFGQTVVLTVEATGTALTYQWYEGQGGDTSKLIVGATEPSLVLPHLYITSAYWVRVANQVQAVDSQAAIITIKPPGQADVDSDGDGVADADDCCPNSDLSATVVIAGWDSGVLNSLFSDGCTISDHIAQIAAQARNHGKFVSGVAEYLNELKKANVITGAQKGLIQNCAAKARIP